ncbi:MAG TPA: hypothetical protein VMV19_04800 [Xanthobacteraceae bacterium]|nr:hypothetical protein [Xanthobacteraceae bacterium]
MWPSNFRRTTAKRIGRISIYTIAALIFANAIWASPARAESKLKLLAYLGFERDFCPNGFAEKCPLLTSEKFAELLKYGRLRLLSHYDNILLTDGPILVTAAQEMIAYARRVRFLDENDGEHRPAILLVAERIGVPDRDVTGTAGRDDRVTRYNQILKPPPRRSFDFGSLRELDPDGKHEWTFFRGADRFTIIFI